MFLNDFKYFYVYLYWGKSQMGHIIMSHACKSLPKNIFYFFWLFFHFKCILLQISNNKCFFINIVIAGSSGVKSENEN